MLQARDILEQTAALGLNTAVVIDCRVVGLNPRMDEITPDGSRVGYEGEELGILAFSLYQKLTADTDAPFLMLCDLFVEGNEPQPGITWSHESRTKAALMGVMSCLLVLFHAVPLRNLIFAGRKLVIATIEDGRIVIQEGRGRGILNFLRNQRFPLP